MKISLRNSEKCVGDYALRFFTFCTQWSMEAGPDGQRGLFAEVTARTQEDAHATNPLLVTVVVLVKEETSL